jgi:hypothetical protein
VDGLPSPLERFSQEKVPLDELIQYKNLAMLEINRENRNPVVFWKN